jgi:hypothetical protein
MGIDYGRKKNPRIGAQAPLEFNTIMKEIKHENCLKKDYPDLSLNRKQRKDYEAQILKQVNGE